jgi:hypothetical protein
MGLCRWVRTGAVVALWALGAVGCSEKQTDTPTSPSREELQNFVTGEAAAALDASGHLVLVTAPAPSEINRAKAESLALAYMKEFGPSIRRTLERERGEEVDFAELQACGPALYAVTPFQPLTDEVPKAFHRAFGSKWIVGLCGPHGDVQVSVAVSALASELAVVDGHLDFGRSDGNEFFSFGVPPGWDGPVGLSPELAVLRAARKTGRRVSELPVLIAPDPSLSYPQGALWRIRVESPVAMTGAKSKRARQQDTLYIGLHSDLARMPRGIASDENVFRIEEPEQPAERALRYSYFPGGEKSAPSDQPKSASTTLRRRPEAPIAFERVTLDVEP